MVSRLQLVVSGVFSLSGLLVISGCSAAFGPVSSAPNPTNPGALRGVVFGGQNPISGAAIQVYAASSGGYGAASILLSPVPVLSDSGGNFVLTGKYTCTPGQQVYLYAAGGNPGGGVNTAVGLMTALGSCPASGTFADTLSYVFINEVTTIGAAYAMAPFASDATHVGSSGTPLAVQGLANAFANSAKLVALAQGTASTTTPAGNGIVPQSAINTLANILASCVNTSGSSSTQCVTLLQTATSDGMARGAAPGETATAAINIAHNPGSNVASLFSHQLPNSPFYPALIPEPNDFTVGINYSGGGLSDPFRIAIDANGNAWVTNLAGGSVTELSARDGSALSPATGYRGGGISEPAGIAIDTSDNVWVANAGNNTITKLSGTDGSALSPATGYGNASLKEPYGIAVDGNNGVWITNLAGNTVTELAGADGSAISPPTGYASNDLSEPIDIAIDGVGDAWVANAGNSTVTRIGSGGSVLSPQGGLMGGGLDVPYSIAIDHSGAAWVTNLDDSVTKLSGVDGSAISPSIGYSSGVGAPYGIAMDGAGNAWMARYSNSMVELSGRDGTAISPAGGYTGGALSRPSGIAIDGTGDVWVTNAGSYTVTEIIGAATPTVTPLAVAIKGNRLGARP